MTDGTSRWVYELYETLFPKKFDSSNSTPTVNYVLTSDGDNTLSWNAVSGSGLVALNDITDVIISSPATGTLLFYNGSNWVNATSSDTIIIPGNLTVSGTTTTINTETIELADNIIVLNSNATGNASENAGIEVERGDDTNVLFRYNETSNKWEFTNDGSTYVSLATNTDSLTEGSTNLYYNQTRFDTAFSAKSTSDLSEGTNLYYTSTRFDTAFSGKDTDDLSEGSSNIYFTNARAVDAIEAVADATPVASDKVIFNDAGQLKQVAFSSLTNAILSGIDSGDITEVVAGAGLTDGGSSGSVTLNVGAGTGITVNANDIQISATYTGQNTITTLGTILTGTWNGTSIADAYIDNDITLTNITQITNRSHSDLQSIGASDHHTKYALTDDLASGEITQLQNIGSATISATQWGYVGGLDQALTTTSNVTFGTVNINTTGTDAILTLTSTDTSSSASPVIDLVRDSSSPASADYLGQIKFKGENSTGGSVVYSKITGKIDDETASAEDGIIEFAVQRNSSQTIVMRLKQDKLLLANSTDLEVSGDAQIDGTITNATWNGDVIASAYLDSDTAHLTTDQTFTGAKRFDGQVNIDTASNTVPLVISRVGSTTGENLKIGVTDTGAFFTHTQDETVGDHFFEFNIDSSTSGTMYYNFKTNGTERARLSNNGLELGNNGVTVSSILDEDTMSSNSATALATQQSIKAYVDSQVATANELSELTDVTLTSSASGDLLLYNGSAWVNATTLTGDYSFSGQITGYVDADTILTLGASTTNTYDKGIAFIEGSGTFGTTGNYGLKIYYEPSANIGYFQMGEDTTVNTFMQVARSTGVITFPLATTFSADLDINANVDVNGTIKLTADGSSSDNFISVGASDDLKLYHASNNSYVINTAVGGLYLENAVTDGGIFLRADRGGSQANYVWIDGSAEQIKMFEDLTIIKTVGSSKLTMFALNDTSEDIFTIDAQATKYGSAGKDVFLSNMQGSFNQRLVLVDGNQTNQHMFQLRHSNDGFSSVDNLVLSVTGDGDVETGGKYISDKGTATTGTFAEFKVDTDRVMSISYPIDDGGFEFDNNNYYVFKTDGGERLIIGDTFLRLPDSIELRLGQGNDFRLVHDGTNSNIVNYTGDIKIQQTVDDASILFQSDDGSGGINTYIDIDGSITKTVFAKATRHNDSVNAEFGSDSDAYIYHNDTHFHITNNKGEIQFKQNVDDGIIRFYNDDGSGAVATYLTIDGSSEGIFSFKKMGVIADGSTSADYLFVGAGQDFKIFHDGSNTYLHNDIGTMYFENNTVGDMIFKTGTSLVEYFRIDTSESATLFKQNTRHQDNIYAYFGSGNDASLRYDGSYLRVNSDNMWFDAENGSMIFDSGNDFVWRDEDDSNAELIKLNTSTRAFTIGTSSDDVYISQYGYHRIVADGSSSNNYFSVGAGDDLKIYHSGSASYIMNYTNDLIFHNDDSGGSNVEYMRFDASANIIKLSKTLDLTNEEVRTNYGTYDKTIINTQLIDLSKTANLVPSDWAEDTSGSASTELYTQNGADTENSIVWGDGSTYPLSPHGSKALLWRAESDGDDASHGGFVSDQVKIDHTETYQFSVWIYWVNKGDASGYHGVVESSTDILNLDGTSNTNPYFKTNLQTANVQVGEWYLSVGYVHGSGTTGTTSYGAVYRQLDGSVATTSTDFRFTTSATTIGTRAFMYYDVSGNAEAFFFDPRIHLVDGSEPSPQQLLGSDPRDFVTLSTAQTISGAKTFSGNVLLDSEVLYFGSSTTEGNRIKIDQTTTDEIKFAQSDGGGSSLGFALGSSTYPQIYSPSDAYILFGDHIIFNDGKGVYFGSAFDSIIKWDGASNTMMFRSEGDITFTLDDDNNSANGFRINNGGDSTVFTVDESGNISNTAFTIPSSIGSAGQVLRVPSSGTTLEWGTITGSGGTDNTLNANITDVLALSTQEIQAVDNGANGTVVWDDSANKLTYKGTSDFRSHIGLATGSDVQFNTLKIGSASNSEYLNIEKSLNSHTTPFARFRNTNHGGNTIFRLQAENSSGTPKYGEMGLDPDDESLFLGYGVGTTTLPSSDGLGLKIKDNGDIEVSGDVSGTTIGGITEANLLDKADAETVSGVYTFAGSSALVAQQASADIQIKLERTSTSAGWMGIGANSAGFQLYNSSTQKQMQISQSGVITLATWNGNVIASAYLDSDTAHLTTDQTFSGAKTFSADTTFTGGNYGIYMNKTGDNNSIRLDSATSYWSYIRFESGTPYADIGLNDGVESGDFQIRPSGNGNLATTFHANGGMTIQNITDGDDRTVDLTWKANQYLSASNQYDTQMIMGIHSTGTDVYGYYSAPVNNGTSSTEMIRFYDTFTEFHDEIRIGASLGATDYLKFYKQASSGGINVLGGDDLVLQADGSTYITLDNSADDVIVSKDLIVNARIKSYGQGGRPFEWGDTSGLGALTFDGSANPVITSISTDDLIFKTNNGGTEFFRLDHSASTVNFSKTITTPFSGSSSTPNFQANGGNFRIYNNTNTYLYNDSGGGNIYLYNDDLDKGIQFFLGTGGFKIYEENPSTEIFRITEDGAISTQGQTATGNYDLFNIGIGRYGSTANAVATIDNFVSSTNNSVSAILKLRYTADSTLTSNNNFIRFEDSAGFVGSINSEVTYSTFTGCHISAVDDLVNYKVGMIVSATGQTSDYVGIDNAQIRVQISDSVKDKRVMGVYTDTLCLAHTEEELNEHGMWCDEEDEVEELPNGGVATIPHECKEWHYSDSEGNRIRCNKEHFKSWSIHEDVIQYNAIGEGMVLVSNVDGDIQTGDYITTSTHAGIGVLQDDDILHSYTVAKITQDIDWDNIEVDEEYGIKIALVTCTYHCG